MVQGQSLRGGCFSFLDWLSVGLFGLTGMSLSSMVIF